MKSDGGKYLVTSDGTHLSIFVMPKDKQPDWEALHQKVHGMEDGGSYARRVQNVWEEGDVQEVRVHRKGEKDSVLGKVAIAHGEASEEYLEALSFLIATDLLRFAGFILAITQDAIYLAKEGDPSK